MTIWNNIFPGSKSHTVGSTHTCEAEKVKLRQAREPLHILVIEDEPVTRMLMKNLFRDTYCVDSCDDIDSAVNEYLRIMPDLVFLDIELGSTLYSGLDILHTLCAIDPDAKVVMVTGHSTWANREAALLQGAYGFIPKPFTNKALMGYVTKCAAEKAQGKV